MASKKKEQEISYLQLPVPQGRKAYKMTKRSWQGLNYRQTIDTGALTVEKNISTFEAPYLTPSPKRRTILDDYYAHPISMFGFDNFLIVIYRNAESIYLDYLTFLNGEVNNIYTGTLQSKNASYEDEYPRSVVQFNVYGSVSKNDGEDTEINYNSPIDPISGSYTKKLLIFPDKKSMNFEITEDNFDIADMSVMVKTYTNSTSPYLPPDSASHNYYYMNLYNNDVYRWVVDEVDSENTGWKVSIPPSMPNIKYATVHLSRLFGVDDDRIYASGYNDYTNWNLDTIDSYNESNAWCSAAQSNTKANGAFKGITTFQNHVICFKHDFMHEIYNTKNPFRIQDIYGEGAIDNRTIQDVDGRLIFVSRDNVKIYTGSNPRIISHYLNINRYAYAVAGTDDRCYYLYCEDEDDNKHLFVYDTIFEQWSEQLIDTRVLNFAHIKDGMFALCEDGEIYKLDTDDYNHSWSFETDLFTNETIDIKHIKKIQMFAYLADKAKIKVYVLYDDEKFSPYSHLVYENSHTGQIAIRVKPRQTASYGIKLHVEGYGYARLYELELIMEAGGGLYV